MMELQLLLNTKAIKTLFPEVFQNIIPIQMVQSDIVPVFDLLAICLAVNVLVQISADEILVIKEQADLESMKVQNDALSAVFRNMIVEQLEWF